MKLMWKRALLLWVLLSSADLGYAIGAARVASQPCVGGACMSEADQGEPCAVGDVTCEERRSPPCISHTKGPTTRERHARQ